MWRSRAVQRGLGPADCQRCTRAPLVVGDDCRQRRLKAHLSPDPPNKDARCSKPEGVAATRSRPPLTPAFRHRDVLRSCGDCERCWWGLCYLIVPEEQRWGTQAVGDGVRRVAAACIAASPPSTTGDVVHAALSVACSQGEGLDQGGERNAAKGRKGEGGWGGEYMRMASPLSPPHARGPMWPSQAKLCARGGGGGGAVVCTSPALAHRTGGGEGGEVWGSTRISSWDLGAVEPLCILCVCLYCSERRPWHVTEELFSFLFDFCFALLLCAGQYRLCTRIRISKRVSLGGTKGAAIHQPL